MTGAKPKITVITTGGTIASRVDPGSGAAVPIVSGGELVAMLPGVERLASLSVHELCLISSWDFTPAFMLAIGQAVSTALEGGADGVVVTQGTDTLEETAYWLDLVVDVGRWRKPVVVTGAMRHNSEVGADGPRNLLDSIVVAAHGLDGCAAPMVVANSQVFVGREVVKTDSFNLATFQSPDQGPIGVVHGERVAYTYRGILASRPLPVATAEARVPLLKWAAGMDDLLLRACADAAVDGVVLEGFGLGHVPGLVVPAVALLRARGIPVVMTTRCPTGPVLPVYGGAGGGRDLAEMGVILAGHLSGPKARLLLIGALGSGVPAGGLLALYNPEGW